MRKPGCIEPVFYFVNGSDPEHPPGYILMAPYSDMPAPEGYTKESAETLADVDRLEKTLLRQERDKFERESEAHENFVSTLRNKVHSDLYARMRSAGCSEYEADFIRYWLQMRDDHPKKKYYAEQLNCYLWARHNDTPKDRGVDEEKVSLDRINF